MSTTSLPSSLGVMTNAYSYEWTDGMGKRWRMTDVGITEIPHASPMSFTALQNLQNPIRVPVRLNPCSKPYAKKKAD